MAQFGYVKYCSSHQQLLSFYSNSLVSVNSGFQYDVVLDFTKVFDRPHKQSEVCWTHVECKALCGKLKDFFCSLYFYTNPNHCLTRCSPYSLPKLNPARALYDASMLPCNTATSVLVIC